MDLTKDERTVKCKVKWELMKEDIKDKMISVQSEVLGNDLEAMKKFNDGMVSCIVKYCIECFGEGKCQDFPPEVHINNILDENYSVKFADSEIDIIYKLSHALSYVEK